MAGQPQATRQRSNLITVVAVALLAYAAADIVHELVGHSTASLLLGPHCINAHDEVRLDLAIAMTSTGVPSWLPPLLHRTGNDLPCNHSHLLVNRMNQAGPSDFDSWP